MDLLHFEKKFEENLFNLIPASLPARMGIGLSGGSDSLCLCWFLHRFAKKHHLYLFPLIVDHGLRLESRDEAQKVESWVKDWGLFPYILKWDGEKPAAQLSKKAREARYALLFSACYGLGISHLFLGHHKNDVLETVLIRKKFQSQWRGMAGISALSRRQGITVVRPFLSMKKAQIQQALEMVGHPWVEDPSNQKLKYQRTQARLEIKTFSKNTYEALIHQTQQYGEKRQQEAYFLEKLLESLIVFSPLGYLRIKMEDVLRELKEEEKQWILWHWIQSVGAPSVPVRKEKLSVLWERIETSFFSRFAMKGSIGIGTLGGCMFIKEDKFLYIFRECRKINSIPFHFFVHEGKKSFFWEQRWGCCMELSFQKGKKIVSLGKRGYYPIEIPKFTRNWVTKLALASCPSLINFEKDYVIPNLINTSIKIDGEWEAKCFPAFSYLPKFIAFSSLKNLENDRDVSY